MNTRLPMTFPSRSRVTLVVLLCVSLALLPRFFTCLPALLPWFLFCYIALSLLSSLTLLAFLFPLRLPRYTRTTARRT
ncbi:hypothetical protein BDP27DRAFT_1344334 [Rhodocollybia butyracea]|uniref:Uncharacterized protein n=1 Tax=Rhodocollybia butyracea TaxID=206335 RepID=A0A9P5P818_9AGAR|nr:hypothetical protein BDP27DRAFT_1344334 [Rhodocollybia butyracea]